MEPKDSKGIDSYFSSMQTLYGLALGLCQLLLIVTALCNDPPTRRPTSMSLQTITDGWLKPYRRYLVPHQKGSALNCIKAGLFAAAVLFAFSLNAVQRGQ